MFYNVDTWSTSNLRKLNLTVELADWTFDSPDENRLINSDWFRSANTKNQTSLLTCPNVF